MQEINSNLMKSIIKQDETTFLRDGKYYSNDGLYFIGLNVEFGQITHIKVSTIEEIEQWFKEKDLKLREIMEKHARDLTEEEHELVFRSFKMPEDNEIEENVKNSNFSVKLTNEEFEELADLAMRTPGMSDLLRGKLFMGIQAIKEKPLERILRKIISQGML